ncbi:hypothetical protein TNCV_1667511 [Trichonephila clavipes]|nr:hypothetical protein TNCV_1667511 [Trichonephila clavipes]
MDKNVSPAQSRTIVRAGVLRTNQRDDCDVEHFPPDRGQHGRVRTLSGRSGQRGQRHVADAQQQRHTPVCAHGQAHRPPGGHAVPDSITFQEGDRFNSCPILSFVWQFIIKQGVEWTQNEMAVIPDFHKRSLFSDEAHFWLNGYVNKQNCRIWSEANPQVYVETPLHPEKLTVWCALWAGGILLQKR